MSAASEALPADSDPEAAELRSLGRRFLGELNKHGHALQFAALRDSERVFSAAGWHFRASEFPVELRSKPTHIDFLLARHLGSGSSFFLAVECKRVNPSRCAWCFARAPYVRYNHDADEFIYERIRLDLVKGTAAVRVSASPHGCSYAHIGLPIRSDQAGDANGNPDRDAIQVAIDQSLRGANGLVEHFASSLGAQDSGSPTTAFVVPVVLTTARLFLSDVNMASACIEDGILHQDDAGLSEVPWLFFQSHVSPGLRHSRDLRNSPGVAVNDPFLQQLASIHLSASHALLVEQTLKRDCIRTVVIVQARQFGRFLSGFTVPSLPFSPIETIDRWS